MPAPVSNPSFLRIAALLLGLVYLPLGLVWAYGLALMVLPLALAGFWFLRAADRRDEQAGIAATPGQQRLRGFARGLLFAGLAASAVALAATR